MILTQHSVNSDWLFNTQLWDEYCTLVGFLLEINEKATLNIIMPYWFTLLSTWTKVQYPVSTMNSPAMCHLKSARNWIQTRDLQVLKANSPTIIRWYIIIVMQDAFQSIPAVPVGGFMTRCTQYERRIPVSKDTFGFSFAHSYKKYGWINTQL